MATPPKSSFAAETVSYIELSAPITIDSVIDAFDQGVASLASLVALTKANLREGLNGYYVDVLASRLMVSRIILLLVGASALFHVGIREESVTYSVLNDLVLITSKSGCEFRIRECDSNVESSDIVMVGLPVIIKVID